VLSHRRSLRRVLGAAAFLAAAGVCPDVGADQAREAAVDTVQAEIAGSDREAAALAAALREPLERMGLTLQVLPRAGVARPPQTEARSHVTIDARSADHVGIRVWLGAEHDGRSAARSVPRGQPDAVLVEQVAYVVRATIESLLDAPEGAAATASVPAAAAPAQATAGAPVALAPTDTSSVGSAQTEPDRGRANPAGGAFGIDIAAFGGAQMVSSSTAFTGAGASLDLAFWGAQPFHPRLWFSGSFSAVELPGSELSLSTTVWGLRALPTMGLVNYGVLRIDAGLGGGVDVVHATPHDPRQSWTNVGAPSTRVDAILSAQILLGLRLTRAAGLFLATGLDDDMTAHRYTAIDRAGRSVALLEPWPIRPTFLVGLCLPLGGASACAQAN